VCQDHFPHEVEPDAKADQVAVFISFDSGEPAEEPLLSLRIYPEPVVHDLDPPAIAGCGE
jgi:hypothetical protein